LAAGCSGIQVSQDYDPATNFSSLNTFRWAEETQKETGDPRIDNPLRNRRIRTAVERVLTTKGFAKSAENESAFQVRYQYILRSRIESRGTSGGVGFGVGKYGRRGGIVVGTGEEIRQYDEGALVIDFYASGSNDLIWRGTGSHRFRESTDPVKASEEINQLVKKILEQFPPLK
jgi:hypothetical protein